MVLAVDQACLDVQHFIAGDLALARLDFDRVLHGRDVSARDPAVLQTDLMPESCCARDWFAVERSNRE